MFLTHLEIEDYLATDAFCHWCGCAVLTHVDTRGRVHKVACTQCSTTHLVCSPLDKMDVCVRCGQEFGDPPPGHLKFYTLCIKNHIWRACPRCFDFDPALQHYWMG